MRELACSIEKLGRVPDDRASLLELPGVGPYIADAVLLYSYGRLTFPLDAGLQRTLRRLYGISKPSAKDPYRDSALGSLTEQLIESLTAGEVRALHQGILTVAWDNCRPSPNCEACFVANACTSRHELELRKDGSGKQRQTAPDFDSGSNGTSVAPQLLPAERARSEAVDGLKIDRQVGRQSSVSLRQRLS